MATSALRARKLRQHSKRSPGLIGDFTDKAQDGHFGRIPQTTTDSLESSNNGDHGEGNNGNGNGNGGGNGGGNNGNGNDNGNNGGGNGNGGGNSNNGGSNGNGGSNNNSGGNGNGGDNGNGGGNGNDSSGGRNEDSNSGSNNSPSAQGDGKGGNTSSGGSGNSHNGSNSGSSGSNRDGDSTKSASSDRDSQPTSGTANAAHDPASSSTPSSVAKSDTSPTVNVSTTIAAGDPSSPFSAQPSVSTSSTDITSQDDSSHHSDRGAIAGGIVGALLFIFLIFGAWIVYKRRCKNRLPPSAEFINNPSSYPFARTGFGNAASRGEKNGAFGGNYGGAGTGAAGQANFGRLSTDSDEGILSEKRPQMGQYRDDSLPQPLPPHPPLPEVLYSTPARVMTPPAVPAPGSAPGTPTTPNGRRIPFGTGTFQFPPRPPQPHPQ